MVPINHMIAGLNRICDAIRKVELLRVSYSLMGAGYMRSCQSN